MTEHENMELVLKQWLYTETGQFARQWEQAQIEELLQNVFGYHAIQIGLPQWPLMQQNRISHKWYTHTDNISDTAGLAVVCQPEQLPFATESIDLLVLPHTLETSSDPHQVLREVERVLVPEGQVVITGFNPWSLWGARDRVPGLECLLPVPPSHQLSPWRVEDWLSLLSFDVTQERQGCYRPLCEQSKWMQRWQFLEKWGARWWPLFGAVYVLKATKRVSSVTMVGLDWAKQKKARVRSAAVAQRHVTRTYSDDT